MRNIQLVINTSIVLTRVISVSSSSKSAYLKVNKYFYTIFISDTEIRNKKNKKRISIRT